MKTILSHKSWAIVRESDGTYWVVDYEDGCEGSPYVDEVELVEAVPTKTAEEFGEAAAVWDYDGELNDVPIYTYWKVKRNV